MQQLAAAGRSMLGLFMLSFPAFCPQLPDASLASPLCEPHTHTVSHQQVMKSVQTPYQRLRLGDSNLLVALDKATQVHTVVGVCVLGCVLVCVVYVCDCLRA